MTPELYARAKELFLEVCDLPAAARAAALEDRCAGEPELRAAVLELLEGDADPVDLDRAVERVREGIDDLRPPPRVRGYRVLERIGEDAAGVAYHARRLSPVRRDLSLRVVKPGCEASFEEQRRRDGVLDSGVTTDGRAFYVVERGD